MAADQGALLTLWVHFRTHDARTEAMVLMRGPRLVNWLFVNLIGNHHAAREDGALLGLPLHLHVGAVTRIHIVVSRLLLVTTGDLSGHHALLLVSLVLDDHAVYPALLILIVLCRTFLRTERSMLALDALGFLVAACEHVGEFCTL